RPATWEVALLSPHATPAQGLTQAFPLPKVIKVQSNQAGETPKGGGLKGFVDRLLDRVKKDKQSPPGQTEPSPPPTSGSLPGSMTFTGAEGGANPAAQTLSITNTGGGTLSWSASESSSWLSLSPASGTTTTETDTITVTVNTAGLTTNTYTVTITLTASGASNTPQQVLVTLAITTPASTKATLTWDPNVESDLAGYKVYVGTAAGTYGAPVDVGKVTTFEVINLSRANLLFRCHRL